MPEETIPPDREPDEAAETPPTGEVIDAGQGRIFPCEQCGADLLYAIGPQSLKCPYCGWEKQLQIPADAEIPEQDLPAMLERIQEYRQRGIVDRSTTGEHEVRCDSCGADVVFQGTLTSTVCPYCASPLQRDKIHTAAQRIPVDGVLPFLVSQEEAGRNLRTWVASLWWAPNAFKKEGASGRFSGVYLPYFTFDALTFTRFRGKRGDHYWETVTDGKQTRRVRKTRWSTVTGDFQRFFDDVPVLAVRGQQPVLIQALEPWPFETCKPYQPAFLAGFFSRTYDIELQDSFHEGRERMAAALTAEIRRRIGGDEQSISDQQTDYSALTYKHLLLPVWLFVYRYQDVPYRVAINAATGEVQGERPYSWIKITGAILAALALVLTLFLITQR